jgi:epoxide hydrolase 4
MDISLEHSYIRTNNMTLHVAQAGPKEGPLLLLLHGFPEFWYGWRRQLPALTAAGFRVWAPDQRGYNLSEKPQSRSAYHLDALMGDVVGLIEAAGREQVYLVGHDWGGVVGWWLANKQPERLTKMVIINAPHHRVMARFWRHSPTQLLRSMYIAFFQLPWLPETAARARNWRLMTDALAASSRPGAFTAADLEQYRRAWAQPGAFTAMLNWYRAGGQDLQRIPSSGRIRVPTLLIWGRQDQALSHRLAQPSIDLCDDGRLVFIEEATHWVQHEEPAQVNRLILDFLARG